MVKEFIEKIMNSEIMIRVKNAIHNFISTFGKSSVKEKVDTFVDNNKKESESILSNWQKRIKKFVSNHFGVDTNGGKIVKVIAKIISVMLAIGFGALVIYMIIKLLPEVVMMIAMIFAIVISAEFIMGVLNRAVQ